jgi:hypothetical protein
MQTATVHLPCEQSGEATGHAVLQSPQWCGSFWVYTQVVPQHANGAEHVEGLHVPGVPPLPGEPPDVGVPPLPAAPPFAGEPPEPTAPPDAAAPPPPGTPPVARDPPVDEPAPDPPADELPPFPVDPPVGPASCVEEPPVDVLPPHPSRAALTRVHETIFT